MRKTLPASIIAFCLLFFFLLQIGLSSCTKTNTVTKIVTDTVVKTVFDTVIVSPHSILYYLTQREWYYDTLTINYTGPGTGTLYYARGSSYNSENFDNVRYVYWRNGSEDVFVDNGNVWYPQTWQFINNDSSRLYYPAVPQRPIPDYQRILKLDSSTFIVYDSTNSAYYHLSATY